jgi:cardiolipin synthase
VVAIAIGVALLVVLALALWSVKHRRDVKLHLAEEQEFDAFVPSLAGLTHSDVVKGNAVEVLQNGDGFFPRLLEAIGSAEHSIHLETFLCEDGELVKQICDELAAKAGKGVKVRVLVDASGGKKLGKNNISCLSDAGVKFARFHPFRPQNLGLLNNRDHRKIVVVDGRIGFVGGHCLVDTWLGNAQDKKHFRDVSVRIEGPAVGRIQSAFTENWIEQTGEVPAGSRYFPELVPCGDSAIHVVYTSPANSSSSVEMLHLLAIRGAQKRLSIQNPYFLPDPEALDALKATAERGVEVRVMLPSADVTDMPIVQHASHHHFGTLLKSGVRIFEYTRTLLHQKVLVVDGEWAAVGSTNFDDRSFELNDEITVGIADPKVAAELDAIFDADLAHSKEIKLDEWKKRPATHKLKDGFLYVFNEQL